MQREMKCIILIGYMCAGKTTVGKRLAKALGRTFYDLDWYVEERYHKRVSDIFATEGEAAFRDSEVIVILGIPGRVLTTWPT